jgi:hypothetical protein
MRRVEVVVGAYFLREHQRFGGYHLSTFLGFTKILLLPALRASCIPS